MCVCVCVGEGGGGGGGVQSAIAEVFATEGKTDIHIVFTANWLNLILFC